MGLSVPRVRGWYGLRRGMCPARRQSMTTLRLHWEFDSDETGDIAEQLRNVTLPQLNDAPVPVAGDMVSFRYLPDELFTVIYRHLVFSPQPTEPPSVHVHLKRLFVRSGSPLLRLVHSSRSPA